ncbi:MAG: hypothetical protein AAF297_09105 [Planctomycetota bacterium]
MGHTFDSTDHEFLFDYDETTPGSAEQDARWLEQHGGQTPLSFPFPLHTPPVPLDEPGSGTARNVG